MTADLRTSKFDGSRTVLPAVTASPFVLLPPPHKHVDADDADHEHRDKYNDLEIGHDARA